MILHDRSRVIVTSLSILLSSISAWIITPSALADAEQTHCFVVSGLRHDWNGALGRITATELALAYGKLGPRTCAVVDNWEELSREIRQLPNDGRGLMIYQGAHGTHGGTAHLNASFNWGDEIYQYLKEFSQDRDVYALIESCMSGDLLARKLRDDFFNPDQVSVDRLCLTTASDFGRSAYVLHTRPAESLATSLKKGGETPIHVAGRLAEGLISAAAWNEFGFTRYLLTENLTDAQRLLDSLYQFVRPASQVVNAAFLQAKLNRKVSDLLPVAALNTEIDLGNMQADVSREIRNLKNAEGWAWFPLFDRNQFNRQIHCVTSWNDLLAKDAPKTIRELHRTLQTFEESGELKACEPVYRGKVMQALGITRDQQDQLAITQEAVAAMTKTLESFLGVASQAYAQLKIWEWTPEVVDKAFEDLMSTPWPNPLKMETAGRLQLIAKLLIGSDVELLDENNPEQRFQPTYELLREFQKKSVSTAPQDSVDARRQAACSRIILK